jgi:hypothetical protein
MSDEQGTAAGRFRSFWLMPEFNRLEFYGIVAFILAWRAFYG